jgi:hypothetical protein
MKFIQIFYLLPMVFLYSCENIFHPQAEIPSYITIEKIDLVVQDPYLQGTASHKIIDAWVYINDDLQGIYEMPATFPVLKSGKNSLKIRAGIKDNGISLLRTPYAFFDFYTLSLDLFPDSIVKVAPVVVYSSSAKFPWIEDFEDPGVTIDSVYPSFVRMKRTTNSAEVFEGGASGTVSLDAVNYIFKGESNAAFTLPKGGTSVYLEVNYKTTASINVAVISNNPSGKVEDLALTIIPTDKNGVAEWNKIYVNLTSEVSGNPSATDYKIVFYSNITEQGLSSAEISMDNIKLVHF